MLTVRIQVIDGTGTFTQSDSQPCRLLTSLHGHYPASSLIRGSPPLSGASVLSTLRLQPLVSCMGFCQAVSERDLFSCFLHRFLCSTWKSRFFAPTRSIAKSARAGGCQGWPAHQPFHVLWPLPGHALTAPSTAAHSIRSGMTIRGEPAFGRADQSRHNLVFGESKDPNHDAAMRIGSEAPRRRTPFFSSAQKP
jgi:hypothetical protein